MFYNLRARLYRALVYKCNNLTSLTPRGSTLLLEYKLHYAPVVYDRVFSTYSKDVNI